MVISLIFNSSSPSRQHQKGIHAENFKLLNKKTEDIFFFKRDMKNILIGGKNVNCHILLIS